MILAGNVLREARQRAGITQRELAVRLGASQPVVARLESGRANPTIETLQRTVGATGHALRVELEPSGWPPIDESLIESNLRIGPAERLRKFAASYRGVRSIAGAALRGRGS